MNLTKYVFILIETERRNITMPSQIRKPFSIVPNTRIINPDDFLQEVRGSVFVAEISMSDLEIFSTVNKNVARIGGSADAYFNMVTPFTRTTNDQWIFENMLDAQLNEFTFPVSLVIYYTYQIFSHLVRVTWSKQIC